jgi:hypothetical protein
MRQLISGAAWAICLVAFHWGPLAWAAGTRLQCTNPYSGASWHIEVDYERRAVDSFPAKITRNEISWRDSVRGGYYSLNRATGELTVVLASSTGGSVLHDVCSVR